MIVEEFEYPWKHLVIDNLLDNETFDYIENYVVTKYDLNNIKKSHLEIHSSDSNIHKKLSPIIFELQQKYFHTLNYAGKKLPPDIYSYIELAICSPGFRYGRIHPDDSRKLMTTVLYVTPETGDGTELYLNNNVNSLVTKLEWKKNRALCFVGQQNPAHQRTWHNYGNTMAFGRVSINMILTDTPNGKY
jgi:hypothetical protein